MRLALLLLLTAPVWAAPSAWQTAGLTPRAAAAHLLSRFSYGPTPGQVDEVARQGPDRWLESQLKADAPDPADARLKAYPALAMTQDQLSEQYATAQEVRQMARQSGMDVASEEGRKETRRAMVEKLRSEGRETERELYRQLLGQKITRGVYTRWQLREVMTDFWFNHFNVSRTNNQARPYLFSYERDAIRAHALGDFRALLEATSHHPAMLLYLNNAESVAPEGAPLAPGIPAQLTRRRGKKLKGLNENYARELMELHTLGVDGGYTQKDVTEAARVLTGWTTPLRNRQLRNVAERFPEWVHTGGDGFVFASFLHDAGPKTVLGTFFPAGHGEDEGERLLDMLASNPRTAERVARKFAVRFVSDEPDPQLVSALQRSYTSSHGNSAAMIRTLVAQPGFWAPATQRAKVKTPLEFIVGSLRTLNADLNPYPALAPWLQKMGQEPYACVPPTGYPDRNEQWVSSGTLVHRINFGFALAAGRVRGVRVSLPPGSLEQVAAVLLPERDLKKALGPVKQALSSGKAGEPDLNGQQKIVGTLLGCPEYQRR